MPRACNDAASCSAKSLPRPPPAIGFATSNRRRGGEDGLPVTLGWATIRPTLSAAYWPARGSVRADDQGETVRRDALERVRDGGAQDQALSQKLEARQCRVAGDRERTRERRPCREAGHHQVR